MVAGLVLSYTSLTRLIQLHHPKRFAEIKLSIRYFYIFELIPLSSFILYEIIWLIHIADSNFITEEIVSQFSGVYEVIWFLYPLIQAYGTIRIKDTADPL